MKQRLIWLAVAVCLLLSGCSWMDGSYVSVKPHEEQISGSQTGTISVSDYQQLRTVLEDLVAAGTESAVIGVAEYDQDLVETQMQTAVDHIQRNYPLGAYAIDTVTYEIGTGGGQPAISVNISYIHGRSELRKVQQAASVTEAGELIAGALENCSEGIVLLVEEYTETDLVQMVEDYAELHPDIVMEVPQLAVGIYPDGGASRVVELRFTYQTSREALRQMQSQVQRVFASASLYINSDASDTQKFAQLYAFLMERFDYQIETSITPSYSLLNHGVGDCEAFAMVYAAMCQQADLDCRIVSGTREGEPWFWNLILVDDSYYHVDLLHSSDAGELQMLTDAQMQGYVWDYSAYPTMETVSEETEKITD